MHITLSYHMEYMLSNIYMDDTLSWLYSSYEYIACIVYVKLIFALMMIYVISQYNYQYTINKSVDAHNHVIPHVIYVVKYIHG